MKFLLLIFFTIPLYSQEVGIIDIDSINGHKVYYSFYSVVEGTKNVKLDVWDCIKNEVYRERTYPINFDDNCIYKENFATGKWMIRIFYKGYLLMKSQIFEVK